MVSDQSGVIGSVYPRTTGLPYITVTPRLWKVCAIGPLESCLASVGLGIHLTSGATHLLPLTGVLYVIARWPSNGWLGVIFMSLLGYVPHNVPSDARMLGGLQDQWTRVVVFLWLDCRLVHVCFVRSCGSVQGVMTFLWLWVVVLVFLGPRDSALTAPYKTLGMNITLSSRVLLSSTSATVIRASLALVPLQWFSSFGRTISCLWFVLSWSA